MNNTITCPDDIRDALSDTVNNKVLTFKENGEDISYCIDGAADNDLLDHVCSEEEIEALNKKIQGYRNAILTEFTIKIQNRVQVLRINYSYTLVNHKNEKETKEVRNSIFVLLPLSIDEEEKQRVVNEELKESISLAESEIAWSDLDYKQTITDVQINSLQTYPLSEMIKRVE